MPSYNWKKIQNDYTTDPDSSLAKIAEKYGVSYTQVCAHSRKENWYQKKLEAQERIRQRVERKLEASAATRLAKELRTADRASDALMRAFKDDAQFNRHLVQKGMGGDYWTEEIIAKKVDTKAIREAMTALKMVEDIKRSILSIQKTDQLQKAAFEKERLELEKQRFELEKERLALLKARDSVDLSDFGVILMPEVKTVTDSVTETVGETVSEPPESSETVETGEGDTDDRTE